MTRAPWFADSGAMAERLAEAEARIASLTNVLVEIRSGYDEYYESNSLSRLLNGESQLRALIPPLPSEAANSQPRGDE